MMSVDCENDSNLTQRCGACVDRGLTHWHTAGVGCGLSSSVHLKKQPTHVQQKQNHNIQFWVT